MAAEDFNPREREAKRREANFQRQEMAMTRTMQRKYRRAVRENDLDAINVFGKQLANRNASLTGGGGIQSAEENNRQAALQAEQAREIRLKAGEEIEKITDKKKPQAGSEEADNREGVNVDNLAENDPSQKEPTDEVPRFKVSEGESNADFLAREANQERFGGSYISPRNKFISDLKYQKQLFDSRDKNSSGSNWTDKSLQIAVDRGKQFGISKDQILAFTAGLDASKSGVAKAKKEEEAKIRTKEQSLNKIAEGFADDFVDKFNRDMNKIDTPSPIPQRKTLEGKILEHDLTTYDKDKVANEYRRKLDQKYLFDVGMKTQKDIDRANELRSIEMEEFKKRQKESQDQADDLTRKAYPDSSFRKEDYFGNVESYDPEDFPEGTPDSIYWSRSTEDILKDKNDPRYKAYLLRKEVFDGMNWDSLNGYSNHHQRRVFQEELIKKAIDLGIDISGFTLNDPDFRINYNESKRLDAIKESNDLIARSY